MPPGLDVTYFANSGSEANELAILMAREFTGNNDVIALRNGYHGGSPLDDGAHLARHLEVPAAAEPRRQPRDQPRPLPLPVRRHAGGDRAGRAPTTSAT